MGRELAVTTSSPEETRILGASLAPSLLPGDVISLSGDLGAGKTVFVQGLAGGLGVARRVTSPTFVIVQSYQGRYPLVHLDVYRLDSFQEVLDLGFEEFLDPDAILVVEWGEAVMPLLPRRFLEVDLRRQDDPERILERRVRFRPHGPEWPAKLEAMKRSADALLDAISPEPATGSRFVELGDLRARDHGRRADSPFGES
jgi:tRNA threonylcarbamoyladenosine biosynthesis protein TsaE